MNGFMVFGNSISNYVMLALLIARFFRGDRLLDIRFSGKSTALAIIMLVSIIISIFVAVEYLPVSWQMNSFSCLIKYLLVIGYFFFLNGTTNQSNARDIFLRGLYVGCIVQAAWGYLQLMLGFAGIKFNTIVFDSILGLHEYQWDSYVAGGLLRMKGIGWETANFALAMIVGYILSRYYKKNIIFSFIFVAAVILSTSRTGYLGLFAVFLWSALFKRRKKMRRLSHTGIISVVVLTFLIGCCLYIFRDMLTTLISNLLSSISDIGSYQSSQLSSSSSSSDIHMHYYSYLGTLLKSLSPLQVLFGTGYFSAGYPFSLSDPYLFTRLSMVGWNPESDFVTLIVGNGLIFTILFYTIVVRALWFHRSDYFGLIIVAILSCGITYLTLRGTWSLLALILLCGQASNMQDKLYLESAGYSFVD